MPSARSTSFERSLDQFRRELSDDQKKEFSGANQKYVNSMLQDMQSKLGREKGLRRLTRIEKFLGAMKHIEALVTIFLNVSEVVAFVWGPIKLALMAATTWTDSVRQLIDAYEEIGEALGNLAFFHNLIKTTQHLQEAIEDYFADILCFHRCVLDVFSRPDWKGVFKWAWGSFRRRVKPILESLKRRQDMLSDAKLQSHAILKDVQDSGAYARDQFKNLQAGLEEIRTVLHSEQLKSNAFQDREMKASLEGKLGVPGFRTDSQLESPEESVESSGNWIFSHHAFRTWETARSSLDGILFLNGSPGAGKSTLARTVIRHLKDKQTHNPQALSGLAYFFFKHDDADRRSTRSMLCHLIAQLINADETIMRLVYERCSSVDQIELFALKVLAQDCLIAHRDAYLILDGLDEAADNESELSLSWCIDQLLPAASSCCCRLKLLVCGQRDGRLDSILSEKPQIRLDNINSHQKDIEDYSKSQAAEISARFLLTQQEEEGMINKIASASQGMFLYAKVVLANLLSMDSVEEFEDELHSDKFPDNLEQAYDRIIQRVLKEAKPSRQNSVKKILGWVICSKRPLRWREIQSRFCINADTGTCNKKGLRRDSCKKICGSLVDITDCEIFGDAESEQIINIVHQSASKYLVHNGTVNLLQEHTDMALFCCRYLSSSPLFEEQESDSFRDVVQSGYFGFLDYASTHYLFHVQDSKPVFGFKVAVETALVGLLNSHGIMISNRLCSSAPLDALCKEDQGKLDLAIQDCVATTREVEERRQEEFSRDNRYSTLCGRTRFKCPKIHCTMFSPGFLTQKDRDMHLTTHERPFKCTYTECFAHITGYASQEGLQAHNKAIHPVDSDLKVTFPAGTSKKKWDIFEACKQGNLAEVKRFHFAGDNTSKSKEGTHFTPFSVAAQNGHGHICKFFMDQCMSPYEDDQFREVDWSPMAEAIRQQNDEVIELLLHGGFSLKYEGDKFRFARYIAMAILCDSRGGLEHLLGERSSLEHSEMLVDVATALIRENWRRYRPCGNKEVHTVDATLMKAWFRRAFPHLVHGEGAESSAGPLIKRPDSADYQKCKSILMGSDGFFHRAFKSRCHPLAAFLMEIADKDDLQVTDKAGSTPLHSFARSYCDTSNCENCSIVTKRIIEIDGAASVNKSDNNGYLPAARAIRTSLVKPLQALRILFLHVSNLNHKDPNGNGLLHYATASAAHLRVFLENDGIDLFIRNNKGQSAFSFAVFAYSTTDTDVLKTLIDADRTLAWTADDAKFCLTPLHYTFADSGNFATSDFILNQRIVRPNVTKFLLSIPEVEHVLNAYLGSSVHWHPEEVREFARRENLAEALRAMDRIGFGM